MWDELKDRPFLVLFSAVGLALVIWAMSFVVRALFAGTGLAIAIIAGGVVGATASAPWVVPAASVGVTGIGVFATYRVITVIVEQTKARPFDFATAVLSLISALLIGVVKEYELKDMPVTALLLGLVTAFAVTVGGALLKGKGPVRKLVGFLFPLLPAGVIVAHVLSINGASLAKALSELTPGAVIAIAMLLISSVILGALANMGGTRSAS